MTIKKFDTVTPLHQAILDQFGSIYKAIDALGFSKKSFYNWIHAGKVSQSARKKIKAMGYCPDTFKEL